MHLSLEGILSQYINRLSSYCVFGMGLFSGDRMNAEPLKNVHPVAKFTFKS